ncbi:MAG: HIT domain-containing protein [Nevskia sp.]|nr:HIT domain-containing protein [Nevskia sp.]
MSFALHPQLAADCHRLGSFELCRLLLMNEARYPWFILVPQRAGLREVYELDDGGQAQLLRESCALGRALMRAYSGDKLNIAALGNVVPQLHLHHIVRHAGDAAWPAPVWGRHPPRPYGGAELQERLARLAPELPDGFQPAYEAPG